MRAGWVVLWDVFCDDYCVQDVYNAAADYLRSGSKEIQVHNSRHRKDIVTHQQRVQNLGCTIAFDSTTVCLAVQRGTNVA
jgi:hypothetical protein